ncbi:uncharacterized protein EAE97_011324 [Botrytis byssoidea]|uniref:MYND-type domain-containing protein n=1 Tax=Botrytis byssoidea TaxID=139641 RepID=A0A9P5HUP3_9HELO|nr:uncharacterized protein EAE97_011324 [Botrytis byssoidea]KAF7921056.1 hypothetical protein EAE97_011324 [Botrytis byssoidea]
MANECAVCHKQGERVLRCSRCRSREYCGADCQTKDWPNHKAACRRQNYILKVDLFPRHFTNPRISRTLSCPTTASFADLHNALQVAFDWKNCHLYDFEVLDHNETMGSEHRLVMKPMLCKITDLDTLDSDSDPAKDSKRTKLYQILDGERTTGKTIHYMYDFGDGWEHVITCSGRADPTTNFVVLGGEGHGCAEDVGGYSGWVDLLAAYESDEPTEHQRHLMSWFENEAHNKDPRGLRGAARYAWDKDRINAILNELDTSKLPGHPTSILLVSLAKESWFDQMYASVLTELRSKTMIKEVTDGASAMKCIEETQKFGTIIVTDAAIMEPEFVAISRKLVEYAKARGILIFGFLLSSLTEPPKFEELMKSYGLGWKFGDYTRETYDINKMADLNKKYNLMPYSMKAVSLKNTRPEDRVYSGPGRDKNQSPAVFAKYGSSGGRIGWIGDVNGEEETTTLLLAMCGL